jgi:tetrahydromethanopterin S-methyltransferase subunit G
MRFAALLAALLLCGADASASVRVAVLPVVVHSEAPSEYLRDGLADMLASRLGLAAGLEAVRVEDPKEATTDPMAARAAARSVGADYVLFGSFTHFGEGASLDLICAPAAEEDSAPPRQLFVHSGTLGEIIPRLDELARKVAAYVTAPGPTPAVSSGPAVPGDVQDALSELEALRERVEALERRVENGTAPAAPEQTLAPAPAGFAADGPEGEREKP